MPPRPDGDEDLASIPSARTVAVADEEHRVTYEQLEGDAFRLRSAVPRGGIVVLRARRARTVAAAIVALDGWAARVDLVGSLDLAPTPRESSVPVDDDSTASTPADRASSAPLEQVTDTRWRLFTSGTTGAPKPVDHSLSSLSRTVRSSSAVEGHRRWGLLYEPTRMAGIQVVLQSLLGRDQLLDATGLPDLPARLRRLAAGSVDSLSATPTLWRQILQSADPGALRLRQITLGGEIADQRILDALARTFPGARVTHVFASTETGAAFSVSDGSEGFPRSFLDSPPRGIRLDVRDGVLFVEAPHTSAAGPDGFASTGDLVTVTEDRVLFLGRASGIVNVAGVKVAPEQVERALRDHADVADAVVRPKRNPFSGWILTAEVVPAPGVVADGLPSRLRAAISDHLGSAHAPASIKVVAELATTTTGKAGR